ncbi:MAG: hypothetical protein ACYSX0_17410 [Planctomycetota bacterium]|jgi:hypothetical protein
MKEEVRQLVGLENVLQMARRRHRECERELGSGPGTRAEQYAGLVVRLSGEIDSADQSLLEDYLTYVEENLLPRIARRVEEDKEQMVKAATKIVDGRLLLQELRSVYSDALDRIRTTREKLGRDPFKPLELSFGLSAHPPPNADRRLRDAHSLVREYLRS